MLRSAQVEARGLSERVSAVVSFVYLGHCLLHVLAPLIFALIPWLTGIPIEAILPHSAVLFGLFLVSSVVLTLGWRRHGRWRVSGWAAAGFLLIIASLWIGHDSGYSSTRNMQLILSSFGSLLLAWAHWDNYRLSQPSRMATRVR